MLQDLIITHAVSRILQRSERQEDIQKLLDTFVDVGIIPEFENNNNQIFYGRRGTGKTHVLKVLSEKLKKDRKNTVLYIDARMLGSTAQFSDPTLGLPRRCMAVYRDVYVMIYNALIEHMIKETDGIDEAVVKELDELLFLVVNPVHSFYKEKSEVKKEISASKESAIDLFAQSTGDLGVSLMSKANHSTKHGDKSTYRVETEDKIVFPEIGGRLRNLLDKVNTHLFILFDEWSSLPFDLQPYLAEFFKRSMFPIPRVVLKIASLEYRSSFSTESPSGRIGFELGADIATAPDLDEHFVYDRNPVEITRIYADILFKHIESELPKNYLQENFNVADGQQLCKIAFTEIPTFQEIARAAEGVIRDLINIFTKAYLHARRRGSKHIDKQSVSEAAREWFEQDKFPHLPLELQTVLRRIVDEVIGQRKARSFLLPRHLERNRIIQQLFDYRIIHLMLRGYADKENPGVRYNIYTIDYGTYVDLMNTSKEPQLDMLTNMGKDVVVPFDDKRSIRRIILDETILSPN